MYKICNKCKHEKLFNDFSKDKRKKDGYDIRCKACAKQYYELKKKDILSQKQNYQIVNKEKIAKNKQKYRKTNAEKISEYNKEYRENNRDVILNYHKEYYKIHKDKFEQYYETNKDSFNARNAKRRSAKLNATPSWLTKKQLLEIEELYLCARMFRLYTGQEYHVDHIVPLQGENVCGLHVPWNLQVITAKENLTKSNKI